TKAKLQPGAEVHLSSWPTVSYLKFIIGSLGSEKTIDRQPPDFLPVPLLLYTLEHKKSIMVFQLKKAILFEFSTKVVQAVFVSVLSYPQIWIFMPKLST
ncbi:MAG: hypothetical protein V1664_02515, partial [Candidatus Uhrbacteria bacterium]